MNQDIFKTLRELKSIKPDASYARHSRMLVLASPQNPASPAPETFGLPTFIRLSTILGAGVVSIFFILGGISYINETYSPLALEGLNQKSLVAEADEINSSIEITLGAIDYLDTSNQVTLKKIAEISKASPAAPEATAMSASAETTATSTAMDAFLIDSDASSVPADRQIDDILNEVAR